MQAKNRYTNGTRAVMAHEPDPEVLPKAERRQFSAEYKLRLLAEADRCSEPGQIGALLRREGLYSSHLSKWRQQRERGALGQVYALDFGHRPATTRSEFNRFALELAAVCSSYRTHCHHCLHRWCKGFISPSTKSRQHQWNVGAK